MNANANFSPPLSLKQPSLFGEPTQTCLGSITLEIIGIPQPVSKKRKTPQLVPNCHVPSMKNSKMWMTKLANGKPLKRPLLISKPEYQVWRERAVQALESQCLSMCLITGEETQQALTRLSSICSLLFEDDSVSDLPQGTWSVHLVPPGKEGAVLLIERLS